MVVLSKSLKKLSGILLAITLLIGLTGCSFLSKKSSNENIKLESSTTEQLVYGISIDVPEGWKINGSAGPTVATKRDVDARLDKKEMLPVIDMIFPSNNNASGMDGRAGLFLTNAKEMFIPQNDASNLTSKDLEKYNQALLEKNRERASKNGVKILEQSLSKRTVGGYLTIVQRSEEIRSGGTMICYFAQIYLPNNKGLVMQGLGLKSSSGIENTINGIMNSIRVVN